MHVCVCARAVCYTSEYRFLLQYHRTLNVCAFIILAFLPAWSLSLFVCAAIQFASRCLYAFVSHFKEIVRMKYNLQIHALRSYSLAKTAKQIMAHTKKNYSILNKNRKSKIIVRHKSAATTTTAEHVYDTNIHFARTKSMWCMAQFCVCVCFVRSSWLQSI